MKTLLATLVLAAVGLLGAATPTATPAVSIPVIQAEDPDIVLLGPASLLTRCPSDGEVDIYAYDTQCPARETVTHAIEHDKRVFYRRYHKHVSFKGWKLVFVREPIDCGGLCVGLTPLELGVSIISMAGGEDQLPQAVVQHELAHAAIYRTGVQSDEANSGHTDRGFWEEIQTVERN